MDSPILRRGTRACVWAVPSAGMKTSLLQTDWLWELVRCVISVHRYHCWWDNPSVRWYRQTRPYGPSAWVRRSDRCVESHLSVQRRLSNRASQWGHTALSSRPSAFEQGSLVPQLACHWASIRAVTSTTRPWWSATNRGGHVARPGLLYGWDR